MKCHNFMDSTGIPSSFLLDNMEYLQYPPSPTSPDFSSMIFKPSASPMAFHPLNMPNNLDMPTTSSPMLNYSLCGPGDGSSDEHSTHTRTPIVLYATTVPRSHRYNLVAVPATRISARAAVACGRKNSTSTESQNEDSDNEDIPVSSGGVDVYTCAVRSSMTRELYCMIEYAS
ncbi:hypothetical protein VKT23_004628 [Stygiomarasmius scandens]|uniref:Uncharacterized protein n=1 Tax=Marasmiellus scandens TaxID=2682957 RepID=A0ABR1JV81_9AGAR